MRSLYFLALLLFILSACAPHSGGTQVFRTPTSGLLSQSQVGEISVPTSTKTPLSITSAPSPTTSALTPLISPSPETYPPPEISPSPAATIIATAAIIANQTSVDRFAAIPPAYISAAAAIKTLFMHQSTGESIAYMGLDCLAGLQNDETFYPPECLNYAQHPYVPYDNRNWNWKLWDEPMADAIAKTDQWVSVATAQQSNYQVLGMKFCYVDGWNQDFDYYRQKMEGLERAYPQKKFIWSTSALWAKSEVDGNPNLRDSCLNIQAFNQQLRAYAAANGKILYDLAAIESHDPNGNLCQSNGCEALCDVYYTGNGGGGGGHPDVDGAIRMAKGFWWLMARISGWNGN